MADTLTFFDPVRPQLLATVAGQAGGREAGRLKGRLDLTLTDAAGGPAVTGGAPFALLAAADVAGLRAGAVLRVLPPRDSRDAETTKAVHVDFADQDFPWRYSPAAPAATGRLKPWLVLLVGKADALQVGGGVATRLDDSVLREHPLDRSHLWAHAQDDGRRPISRLLSPCVLAEFSEYVAAVVPAFNDAGDPAWTVSTPPPGGTATVTMQFGPGGTLRVFDWWRFWTGEKGDFETLAEALRVRKTGGTGTVSLRYRRPVAGVDVTLQLRGAITALAADPDQAADVAAARADLDRLNDPLPDTALDRHLGLPAYGRPWVADPDSAAWSKALNEDPRYRATAGLGTRLGVEAQDELMDAAVAQAGALDAAAGRVRNLALGLEAAGRLWGRRLPSDPVRRLAVFGPALGRLPADGGGTVLDRVTGAGRTLPPAAFSSAAARILRGRTARARHLAAPVRRADALALANAPLPPVGRGLAGLPHADDVARLAGEKPLEVKLGLAGGDLPPELRDLVERFAGRRVDAAFVADLTAALRALGHDCGPGPAQALGDANVGVAEREMLVRAVRRCVASRARPNVEGGQDILDAGIDGSPLPDPDPERPVDLGALGTAVAGAIDPTADTAPALGRVRATIQAGVPVMLRPLELPLGLDFPTWQLVNKRHPDWLLPGASGIPGDSILSLKTNPTFTDAFLVGLNAQFLAEMRWRGLAARRTFTPLRMFWGYVNHATGRREADILPISTWADKPAAGLGDLSHQAVKPGDATGKEDLVLLFKTDLFRRYPATLVYLVKPGPAAAAAQALAVAGNPTATAPEVQKLLSEPPDFSANAADRGKRACLGPIFMGTLAADLVFFAFDVAPATLDEYWLVIDEPPADLRFRNPDKPGAVENPAAVIRTSAAAFAKTTIDRPTRVAISGRYLEERGLS
jgi:hypothetical protein